MRRRPGGEAGCPGPVLASLLVGLLAVHLGAATAQAPTPRPKVVRVPAKAPATAAPPVTMRLNPAVQPRAATLSLKLDPAQPRYEGTVEIDVTLASPQDALTLHARGLTLGTAFIEQGSQRLPARSRQVDAERVELRPTRRLAAGKARLTIAFRGIASDLETDGLFRRQDGGQWGAYTQFQPASARRAFPLFDEPGWKLPWTLQLTVPTGHTGLANMPVQRSDDRSDDGMPGWQTLRFAPTPPLPSYLLAWAVGHFDLVPVPPQPGPGFELPMRIATPRGRAAEAAYAASVAPRAVAWLEQYLDMPMPFTQLDSLAVPVGRSFGAMEHPGLITYAQGLLLAGPGDDTAAFRREHLNVAAHEVAHQWFGNLVTMRWWDDLWLNESFANLLGDRTGAALMPDGGFDLAVPQARTAAMRADRVPGVRSVQQPVLRDDDLGDLWNPITYEKGQVVLAMAEAWLGDARWRMVLHRYLERHGWGHAGSDDFFAVLAEQDADLAQALPGFIRQPGIPLLRATLRCDDGPPRLDLAVERLRPLGSPADAQRPHWTLPLRVRSPAGDSRGLLTGDSGTLPLPDTSCPAWVQPNADGSGYWRSLLALPAADGAPEPALLRLAAAPGLKAVEALALLDDARGLHEAGLADTDTLLALVSALAGHPRHEVVLAAADTLAGLAPLVPEARRPAYTARWQAAFGARAGALGWVAPTGQRDDADDNDARAMRAALLPALAEWGEIDGGDTPLRAEAVRLATAWLATMPGMAPAAAGSGAAADEQAATPPQAPDPALRGPLLATAALSNDPELFAAIDTALHATRDRRLRHDLLAALGRFRAPALAQRARALLLDGTLEPQEGLRTLLRAQAQHPATRAAALAWMAREHRALSRRASADAAAQWPALFDAACSDDEARAVQQAFGPHADKLQGGRAALQRTLSAVALCSAWRRHHAAAP